MNLDSPFNYERTFNIEEAEFVEWRISRVVFKDTVNSPKTDEEILTTIKGQKEDSQWYTTSYWRSKGVPCQQLELQVGADEITIYNYSNQLSPQHFDQIKEVLQIMGSKFPQALKNVNYILINNDQPLSHLGDPKLYPANGMSYRQWRTFELYPRSFNSDTYRIPPVSNLVGVMSHEFTHSIEQTFQEEWAGNFQWRYCWDAPEEWVSRPTPDGTMQKYFHVVTGEMSPQNQFPLQPEQCVSQYAKQNPNEDICESMVAYLFNPELLKKISPEKYRIISSHDVGCSIPKVNIKTVRSGKITLPKIEAQIVKYFIHEP